MAACASFSPRVVEFYECHGSRTFAGHSGVAPYLEVHLALQSIHAPRHPLCSLLAVASGQNGALQLRIQKRPHRQQVDSCQNLELEDSFRQDFDQ